PAARDNPGGRCRAPAAGRGRRRRLHLCQHDDGDALLRPPRGRRRARRRAPCRVPEPDRAAGDDAGLTARLKAAQRAKGRSVVTGKFLISVVVMFVMTFALSFFVHGFLLQGDYMEMIGSMRKPEDVHALMPWMVLAHALFGVAFVW